MIFDKKLGGFRLVPINRHVYFEKQKQSLTRPVVKPSKPTQGLISSKSAPKKSAKTFIKNLTAKIKSHNTSFVGGSKLEKKPGAKKNPIKPLNSDSDSLIYGGEDGNAEFEDQLG